jgi:hypothetical protein
MREFVLANDHVAADRHLRKVGPACAERPILAGLAPIHMASFSSAGIPLLKIFIEAGVSIEAVTEDGETPLQIALRLGNKAVAETLVSGGAEFGERETKILENLSAENSVIVALTGLLGKAKQDRLVAQITGARQKLHAYREKKKEAQNGLALWQQEEGDKKKRGLEEREKKELEQQAYVVSEKQSTVQQELQRAGNVSQNETKDGDTLLEADQNFSQDYSADEEGDE